MATWKPKYDRLTGLFVSRRAFLNQKLRHLVIFSKDLMILVFFQRIWGVFKGFGSFFSKLPTFTKKKLEKVWSVDRLNKKPGLVPFMILAVFLLCILYIFQNNRMGGRRGPRE